MVFIPEGWLTLGRSFTACTTIQNMPRRVATVESVQEFSRRYATQIFFPHLQAVNDLPKFNCRYAA